MSDAGLILLQVDGTPGTGSGPAGLGVVVRAGNGRILTWRCGRTLAQSNNEAEWEALLLGLRVVRAGYRGRAVRCLSDSRLVVDQMCGRAQGHAPALRQRQVVAQRLCAQIGPIDFVYVPRELNQLADALAWEALGGTAQILHYLSKQGGC